MRFTFPGCSFPSGARRVCRAAQVFCVLSLLIPLAACAPKDIGTGGTESVDARFDSPPGPDPVTEMRYPTIGSLNQSREKYFYRMSQPSIIESVQSYKVEQFKSKMNKGLNPEDSSYREIPKTRSPFRE